MRVKGKAFYMCMSYSDEESFNSMMHERALDIMQFHQHFLCFFIIIIAFTVVSNVQQFIPLLILYQSICSCSSLYFDIKYLYTMKAMMLKDVSEWKGKEEKKRKLLFSIDIMIYWIYYRYCKETCNRNISFKLLYVCMRKVFVDSFNFWIACDVCTANTLIFLFLPFITLILVKFSVLAFNFRNDGSEWLCHFGWTLMYYIILTWSARRIFSRLEFAL